MADARRDGGGEIEQDTKGTIYDTQGRRSKVALSRAASRDAGERCAAGSDLCLGLRA
jgi:hypothetical protein